MSINKKYIVLIIATSLLTLNLFSMNLFVQADKPTKPTLEFSWEETAFSYSFQKVWAGDSIITNISGSYTDTYETHTEKRNNTERTAVRGYHTFFHDANYSYLFNSTITGNITVDIDFQVYRVDIDYGSNVKVIWIAFKQGTVDIEFYQLSYIINMSGHEDYHQDIESQYEKYSYDDYDEPLATWNSTNEISGRRNLTYYRNLTKKPFVMYKNSHSEYALPLILTIQLFTTEKKDKIAWINMIRDTLYIYKDLDANTIYSIIDKRQLGTPPNLYTTNENYGFIRPNAYSMDGIYTEWFAGHWYNHIINELYPIDKSVSEIASTIKFTPPTSTPDANVSWGIQYPDFPTYVHFDETPDEVGGIFATRPNSSYIHSCPTDYSYEFDYIVGENQTNLDITWELGKITNTSFYDAMQGYGIMMPQYNYFLASFNIDEIDSKALAVPCDKFSFESNDTLVAEINMGGPHKSNYTLYDFPSSNEDSVFESRGGSVHPIVMWYGELFSYYEQPLMNTLYTLLDFVKQDPSFGVADDLFRLETQNYPVWSGERLRHDPTLTVYFEEYEVEEEITDGGKKPFIPGYNYALLIGTVGVITFILVLKKRKRKFNLT